MIAPPTHIYRVTVRGRFRDLDDRARRYLATEQANHDIFASAFTPEGTLTYDLATGFFNLRYEVRTAGGDVAAADAGRAQAAAFLRTMHFAHGELRVNVFDASAVWDSQPDPAADGERP